MRITSRGQVTIPIELRERLRLLPGTEVDIEQDGDTLRLRRCGAPRDASRGAIAVARLRGLADIRTSTDEILALTRSDAFDRRTPEPERADKFK